MAAGAAASGRNQGAIDMKFSAQARSEVIQFRATPEEAVFLKDEAARRGVTVAQLVREALDEWLARQGQGKSSTSSDSGLRKPPSDVKAKVKAASKRSPSKTQGTVQ
jgi:hypothetical protein